MFWKGINMIEAQETLLKLQVADYPNMELSDKKKFQQQLKDQAYFKQKPSEIKVLKTSDIGKVLGAFGVG